jgi:hypothetical protein
VFFGALDHVRNDFGTMLNGNFSWLKMCKEAKNFEVPLFFFPVMNSNMYIVTLYIFHDFWFSFQILDCVNATDFVNYDVSLIGRFVVSIICFFDLNIHRLKLEGRNLTILRFFCVGIQCHEG